MTTERHQLIPPPVLHFENNGMELVATNYWQTENCAVGLFFLSSNAGCVRLLVPSAKLEEIEDMTRGVGEIVLTRGELEGVRDCVEVLFEDYSASPYCIHVDPKQVDRRWVLSDEGAAMRWRFAIYREEGKVAEFSHCFLRHARRLPCALPWGARCDG